MFSSFNLPVGFVDENIVQMARQNNAGAIVRVVLVASAREFDAVSFWQAADADRFERQCGDSSDFINEGIVRVMALADKLQCSLDVCRQAIKTKIEIRDTMAGVAATLASIGAANFDFLRPDNTFVSEIALLERAAAVQEHLLSQAIASLDELAERAHALYGNAPAKGFGSAANSALTIH